MASGIKVSLAAFEIDVGEFVQVIRDLASVKLDAQTQAALKTLIAEARKSFDVVVDVVTPLYALNSETTMRAEFPKLYANFKSAYLRNSNEVRTHCHIVKDQIGGLKESQAWKENIPLLRNAFNRLVQLEAKWIGNDDDLAYKMDRFLDRMDGELGQINQTLPTDATAACRAVTSLLSDTEKQIKNIKSQLDELRIVSNRLDS
jgi:hypothetical protein